MTSSKSRLPRCLLHSHPAGVDLNHATVQQHHLISPGVRLVLSASFPVGVHLLGRAGFVLSSRDVSFLHAGDLAQYCIELCGQLFVLLAFSTLDATLTAAVFLLADALFVGWMLLTFTSCFHR